MGLAVERVVAAEVGQVVDVVDTLGGRMHVRWDANASATPHGQLAYFAQYLHATQVFERWVNSCPLSYSSGNASAKRDVLGTMALSVLAGHKRYAHVSALRGDSVAAQALGMKKVVSEDTLRRAVASLGDQPSREWLQQALLHSVRSALERPWIMDIDASVKPLYGHQDGAEVSYNPHKPGRPSHGCTAPSWPICAWCWSASLPRASCTAARTQKAASVSCSIAWGPSTALHW